MTVNELIERLQEAEENGLGECEVRLATQPSYPLQSTVGGVTLPEDDPDDDATMPVVYIFEGQHPDDTPYAPGWAFDGAR